MNLKNIDISKLPADVRSTTITDLQVLVDCRKKIQKSKLKMTLCLLQKLCGLSL